MFRSLVFGVFAFLWAALALSASAQQSVRPYDGIQAGLDAYRLGEERRRSDFQQQIDVNEDLRAWSGLPNLAGETMWYRDAIVPGYGYGAEYGYGYGWAGPRLGPAPYGFGRPWAPSYVTPYRQPAGRWEGQTGPNRWESHPIYDPPITPYRASPPVDSAWLDRTPYATPRPRVYEWSDGESGVRDTEVRPSPPPLPSSRVEQESIPPPRDAVADEFEKPRRSRNAAEPILPEPPPPRRLREF